MSRKQTRSEARIEAFKLIFQSEINDEEPEFLIDAMLSEYPESADNINYIKTVFLGVLQKREEIDLHISTPKPEISIKLL